MKCILSESCFNGSRNKYSKQNKNANTFEKTYKLEISDENCFHSKISKEFEQHKNDQFENVGYPLLNQEKKILNMSKNEQ